MEMERAPRLEDLVASLINSALCELNRHVAEPGTLAGRKAVETAAKQLTHLERLVRLSHHNPQKHLAAQSLPLELSPTLASAVAALKRSSERELVAMLAQNCAGAVCACAAAPMLIPARKAFRCHSCGAQRSFLRGTVLAGSHVPLVAWFAAACIYSHLPEIRVADLARVIGVSRLATVRRLRNSLRTIAFPHPLSNPIEIARTLIQGGALPRSI